MPVLGLAAAFPAMRAADDKPLPNEDRKQGRLMVGEARGAPFSGPRIVERRGAVGRPELAMEKESVTFLGVETGPVSPTLTAQLGLPDGTGLVVIHLVPDGPAAAVLKEHDILVKLDDQLLIEQRQLSVLIRNHKEGDEVTITYLRSGKQATAKVKLTKHEVPKMAMQPGPNAQGLAFVGGGFGGGGPAVNFDMMLANPDGSQGREMVQRMLPIMGGARAPGVSRYDVFTRPVAGPGEHNVSVTVNTGNSHMVLNDDAGSIELTIKEGKKELVAKNAKGEQIFSGPVNTPEERKSLPGDVRDRLERLEDSTQFGVKPGADFKTETKVFRPRGQSISAPAPIAPTRPPLFF